MLFCLNVLIEKMSKIPTSKFSWLLYFIVGVIALIPVLLFIEAILEYYGLPTLSDIFH